MVVFTSGYEQSFNRRAVKGLQNGGIYKDSMMQSTVNHAVKGLQNGGIYKLIRRNIEITSL